MKFTLNLEIQEGVSLECIRLLLLYLGAEFGTSREDEYTGNLPNEGAYFAFRPEREGFTDVAAELSGLRWKVGARGIFYSNPQDIMKNLDGIKDFIKLLPSAIDQEFVLSLEYWEIYAIRDGEGLRLLNEAMK